MLSTKIRTTVITLIAASSVALAGVQFTPVASASPNTHAYAKTVGKRWHNTCANAQVSFENAIILTEVDAQQGDLKNASKDLDLAIAIHDNAKASGCSVS